MEPAQALYDLQTLDQRIGKDAAALEADRAKMQEPAAVRHARAAIASAEQQLAALQKETRSSEQEAQIIAAKKAEVHAKLYGGRVTVPRELAALESEESGLAASLSQVEDRQLDLMAKAEQTEAALSAAQANLQAELDRWRTDSREAHDHIAKLEAELQRLQADRAAQAATISPANLATYERLRRTKAGIAVGVVQDSMCQACRTTLPSRDVQRARGADPPHVCENCGRLLYVR